VLLRTIALCNPKDRTALHHAHQGRDPQQSPDLWDFFVPERIAEGYPCCDQRDRCRAFATLKPPTRHSRRGPDRWTPRNPALDSRQDQRWIDTVSGVGPRFSHGVIPQRQTRPSSGGLTVAGVTKSDNLPVSESTCEPGKVGRATAPTSAYAWKIRAWNAALPLSRRRRASLHTSYNID